MNRNIWIRASIAAVAIAILAISMSMLQAQQPQAGGRGGAQAPAAPTGPLAPEKYKNIQVLTTVPADQFDLAMRFVSAAVAMPCVNCHVQDAATGEFSYDKDDKRMKQTARTMMKLVNTVNAGGFGVNVNCGTCHAGHNQPVGLTFAEMMTPEQMTQAAAQAAAPRGGGAPGAGPGGPPAGGAPGGARGAQPPAPPIDDVLNKYIDAIGGRAAVEKLTSLSLTGTISTRAGQSLAFTIDEKANKYRETQSTRPDATARGFDGKAGWSQAGARATDLIGFPLDEALRTSDLNTALHVKEKYPMLAAAGRPTPVNGKDTIVATGRDGVTTEQFYFDSATGLLVRRVISTRTPLGQLREQIDYADFRSVAGVKIPFEIKRTNWDSVDTLKVTDAKPNVTLDDARFDKPKG